MKVNFTETIFDFPKEKRLLLRVHLNSIMAKLKSLGNAEAFVRWAIYGIPYNPKEFGIQGLCFGEPGVPTDVRAEGFELFLSEITEMKIINENLAVQMGELFPPYAITGTIEACRGSNVIIITFSGYEPVNIYFSTTAVKFAIEKNALPKYLQDYVACKILRHLYDKDIELDSMESSPTIETKYGILNFEDIEYTLYVRKNHKARVNNILII